MDCNDWFHLARVFTHDLFKGIKLKFKFFICLENIPHTGLTAV